MQNFFGFIDYTKALIYPNKSNNQRLYQEPFSNFNLLLLHNREKSSITLNSQTLFIYLMGDISNYSELLRELNIKKIPKLSTIKLLEHLYKKSGEAFTKKLEGRFSLILLDKESEKLMLIKDNIGSLPLNYYQNEEFILFGSNIRQFKRLSRFKAKINPQSLASYLQFGSIIQPNTIFKGCYKVESGSSKCFNLKSKRVTTQYHWRLESCYNTPKREDLEPTIITRTHQLLDKAIDNTLSHSKHPIALSLSGGYDSSTITALLQKKSSKRLHTFTIGFNDAHINEAVNAKKIAKHLGTEHHEHYFTGEDALKVIPKLCEVYDEPFAEYAGTPTLLTAQMVQEEGIEELFAGDGGDEVFATADDITFFQYIHKVPHTLRKHLTSPFKKLPISQIEYLNHLNNFATKYSKFLNILSSKNIPKTVEAKNLLFREDELQGLIQHYTHPIITTFDQIEFDGYQEPIDEITGTYFKTTMTDGELIKSYGAMNHYGITLHTPFLDKNLIEYMATIPSHLKIKKGVKKYLLKEIAHQYIPKSLLDHPKRGFDIPFSKWMREELKDLVYEQINEERLNKDKIFYTINIIKIRNSFYQGNDAFKYKLWRIFIFQLWYENLKG